MGCGKACSYQTTLSARNVAHSHHPYRHENSIYFRLLTFNISKDIILTPLIAAAHRNTSVLPEHADSWTHRVHTRRFDRHVTQYLPLLKLSVKASSRIPPPPKSDEPPNTRHWLRKLILFFKLMVPIAGFEPATPSLRMTGAGRQPP